jgi:hypothetical protein
MAVLVSVCVDSVGLKTEEFREVAGDFSHQLRWDGVGHLLILSLP